ncbi:MAG: hypothetical protein U9Q80_05185 [Bacillota bacterium]|nr:hypothetical protein [Bacillota bacterium]
MLVSSVDELSDYDIEKRARDMGMIYPDEMKITDFYKEEKND